MKANKVYIAKLLLLGILFALVFPACAPMEGMLDDVRKKALEENSHKNTPLVIVGAQSGTLMEGEKGSISFSVTTANIANGLYTIEVENLPTGVTVSGQVTINDDRGTLTLAGDTTTAAGEYNNLILTIAGISSPEFTLIIYSLSLTFNSVTANGDDMSLTTELTLNFSGPIADFTENDITLSGVSGIAKGALGGSGPTYTLPISGFSSGGTLTVAVAKAGFTIGNPSRTVTIYYAIPLTGTITIESTPTANHHWVNATLSANTVSLGGKGAITYQWKRGAANVGTNSSTYTVTDADRNNSISVVVTRAGYVSSVTSNSIAIQNLTGIYELAHLQDVQKDLNYIVINNIDADDWMPKNYGTDGYKGNFDGNGKTIRYTITSFPSDGYLGLFRIIGSGATVKNLKLTGYIEIPESASPITTIINAGAVAGSSRGAISNVSSSVTIGNTETSNTCYVGGIVGYMSSGTIQNCYIQSELYPNTTTNQNAFGGGIAGRQEGGTIQYCWVDVDMEVWATDGRGYAGGIVGYQGGSSPLISNCVAVACSIGFDDKGDDGGRIAGNLVKGENNFANEKISAGWNSPITGTHNDKNGSSITIAETVAPNGAWWTGTAGWETVWGGSDESKPWKWSTSINRPVLWFE